jgi:hypothetical protein
MAVVAVVVLAQLPTDGQFVLGDKGTQMGVGQVDIPVRPLICGYRDLGGGDNQRSDPAHTARCRDRDEDGCRAGLMLEEAFVV